jgi:hypothetical protein
MGRTVHYCCAIITTDQGKHCCSLASSKIESADDIRVSLKPLH